MFGASLEAWGVLVGILVGIGGLVFMVAGFIRTGRAAAAAQAAARSAESAAASDASRKWMTDALARQDREIEKIRASREDCERKCQRLEGRVNKLVVQNGKQAAQIASQADQIAELRELIP